jgi:hypothetical protein
MACDFGQSAITQPIPSETRTRPIFDHVDSAFSATHAAAAICKRRGKKTGGRRVLIYLDRSCEEDLNSRRPDGRVPVAPFFWYGRALVRGFVKRERACQD